MRYPYVWEVTEQRTSRRGKTKRKYVSLNRRGEIAMNWEAFREIYSPATVTLLYDTQENRIGVKYPVPADRNFFPARGYGRGNRMRVVRAARMMKQFGVRIGKTLVFIDPELAWLDGSPMLILPLDDENRPG